MGDARSTLKRGSAIRPSHRGRKGHDDDAPRPAASRNNSGTLLRSVSSPPTSGRPLTQPPPSTPLYLSSPIICGRPFAQRLAPGPEPQGSTQRTNPDQGPPPIPKPVDIRHRPADIKASPTSGACPIWISGARYGIGESSEMSDLLGQMLVPTMRLSSTAIGSIPSGWVGGQVVIMGAGTWRGRRNAYLVVDFDGETVFSWGARRLVSLRPTEPMRIAIGSGSDHASSAPKDPPQLSGPLVARLLPEGRFVQGVRRVEVDAHSAHRSLASGPKPGWVASWLRRRGIGAAAWRCR